MTLSQPDGCSLTTDRTLLNLIRNEKWVDAVSVIRDESHLVLVADSALRTPLHKSCEKRAPLFVIQTILNVCPSSALAQDIFGFTPLHLVLSSRSCLDSVRALLKACPKAARTADKQALFPLQVALGAKLPLPVIELLTNAYPAAWRWDESSSRTSSLHFATLDLIREIFSCPVNPTSQMQRMIRSPLHWALTVVRQEPPSQTVNLLEMLDMYPNAVTIVDHNGRLPLHIALKSAVFPDIILALLHRCPEAASVADKYLKYPIHYAFDGAQHINADKLPTLIAAFPDALMRQDYCGQCPLHKACLKEGYPFELMKLLIEACPDSLFVLDKDWNSPMDIFLISAFRDYTADGRRDEWFLQTLNLLADAYCLEKKVYDTQKVNASVPLHLLHMCLRQKICGPKAIQLLITLYPEQLNRKDELGQLPLHVEIESIMMDVRSKDIGNLLIEAYPNALKVRDRHGRYPLATMMATGRQWNCGIRCALVAIPTILFQDCCVSPDILLPYVLARFSADNDVDMLYHMITGYPHLLHR